jgi:hypothetical protein
MTWDEKTYRSLIDKGKLRGLKKDLLNYYTEFHHIVPKCIGGSDDDENLVLLTYREHIIAHMLLSRIHNDSIELKHVVYLMFNSHKNKTLANVRLSTKQLEEIRLASVEFLRQKFTGREIKPEWVEKAKETKKLRYGGKLTEKQKTAQARGRVGMRFSETRKKNMSKSLTGIQISEETKKKQSKAHKRRICTLDGSIIYDSIKDCSKEIGLSESEIKKNILQGTQFKYLDPPTQRKVIDPDGIIHNSIRACGIKYNRDGKTIKNWIENYPGLGFKYYK